MDQNSSNTSSATSSTGGPLVNQALQWLNQDNLGDLFSKLSPSLKNAGTQIASRYNRLSTTQKIVGGALLILGATYLSRRGSSGNTGSTSQADTLNELLYFVNDRIEGYQRAVDESTNPELSGYYKQLVSQSQMFANELNKALREQGGEQQTSTTLKGKLYRSWMDVKAAITGTDEKAILGSNVYGEEWAIKAYEDALSDNTLTGSLRQAVERQYSTSKKTYDRLKKLEEKQ
ncbi:PA2169 family four-helix-bundle protein [Hymenobacter taeanensis]|uniref:PA2169 family four-helix-bundle protein n=1 Tax=Hymenobacter taeanensis TaxID=2735321 RepID=A0A6M6BIE9_9BACT|nr:MULTISPECIES: PA2169 family four-helix-bundle protein [Hymenobacter]QJX47907.1 PA2169 family four-helix-bundle protein [Hymenobacter taeanensis]UOQ82650.1 PA2169 family four-helix-bundle protein [Hymenobacter sp. 5414T-23]